MQEGGSIRQKLISKKGYVFTIVFSNFELIKK